MRHRLTLVLFLLLPFWGYSQNKANIGSSPQARFGEKIKVYLLGTFHFTQTDSTYDVLDEKHQRSIEELTEIIASYGPDKVFVERQPEFESRNKLDELYRAYLKSNKIKRRNEVFQIGFRVAGKLNHKKVYQCDHPGMYGRYYNAAKEYAEKNDQTDIMESQKKGTVLRADDYLDEDSIMQQTTLLEYLQWLNSELVTSTSHAFYISNFTQIGSTGYYNYDDDDTLIGAEITSDWYRRNIMIYSKMINQLDYNEEAIFLVIGADHIPILANLFRDNPYFEVINPEVWLKKSNK